MKENIKLKKAQTLILNRSLFANTAISDDIIGKLAEQKR